MKQFDLEQAIMASWGIKEDLILMYKTYGEDLSNEGRNLLLGLIELTDLRHQHLFSTFEEMLKEFKNEKDQ
jgi:hypothetical protein